MRLGNIKRSRSLLQSVQGPREQAHMIRMVGVDEADRLLAVHLLGEMTVEKSIGDIHLVHRPRATGGEVQNGADRARLDNRGKRIRKVDTGTLAKSADPNALYSAPACHRAELVLEDPLVGDDVGARRMGDQLPGPIVLQRVVLLLHGGAPVRVAQGGASRGGHRREGGGGRHTRQRGGRLPLAGRRHPAVMRQNTVPAGPEGPLVGGVACRRPPHARTCSGEHGRRSRSDGRRGGA